MKRSPRPSTKKQETHARIVSTAAREIRRRGYDGVSVAEIMKDAGRTHGGFYAHFASRDALVVEAVDAAAAQSLEALGKAVDGAAPLGALLDRYLSDRHADAPETGCTLAALGSETRRQAPAVRRVTTRRTKELIELVSRALRGRGKPGTHDDALAVLSCMVGALVVSRAIDDPALAKSIRAAARHFITAHAG